MPADLKASPQNPLLAPFARGLRSLQELASRYQVDPRVPLVGGTGVDEMLSLPGAASLTEDVSYYGPRALIRGGNVATGGIGTFRPDPRITDVADVASLAAPIPAAGRAAARGTASAVNRAMLEGTGPLAQLIPEAARPAFVVKPKGGNWVAGGHHDPRKVVEPLRSVADDDEVYINFMRQQNANDATFQNWLLQRLNENPNYRATRGIDAANQFLAERGQPLLQRSPLNSWIESKLTKYIKNEMATPEDPVRLQADQWAEQQQKLLADKDAQIAAAVAKMEEARKARGFTPEMMTRSQEQIRQLRKERQFIAEQRGTHLQNQGAEMVGATARYNRLRYGMPEEPAATSRAGLDWENKADTSIVRSPYQEMLGLERIGDRNMALEQLGGKYAAENPEALAYGTSSTEARGLEFDHMVHELRNALDPQSGLPEELLLSPKDLDKMSVAQASRHVDKINAWRAVQAQEANMAIAGNAATQVVKEYPEAGKRWVELRLPDVGPEAALPEGYRVVSGEISGKTFYRVLDPEGNSVVNKGGSMIHVEDTPEKAVQKALKSLGVPDLQKALKYEGEQLSHCVGGYCPDVESGKSRIFSLRSDDGKPLTTIEVHPWRSSQNESLDEFEQRLRADPNRTEDDIRAIMSTPHYADSINQIKGYRNRAPGEQVDFVLDFLSDHPNVQFTYEGKKDLTNLGIVDTDPKSGTWRQVLQEKSDRDQYLSAQQLESAINDVMRFAKEENPDLPRFVKKSDLYKMLGGYEFAAGGLVSADYDPEQIDRIVQNFAEGGKVEPRSAWVKAGDTVVETGLRLYDKIADREKMPANQRIFLETFLDNKREPIDERAFSDSEMRAIRNLIGITGDKPQGSVQYEDYGRAGLNPTNTANTGDILETSKNPLESVRTTLGRFNYRRDPKTGKFIIEDQYDFNMPQTFKPNELGDYAFHPQMVANPFLALRVYAGSKMPQGTGRKVRVQVPFAEGGQFNQETVDAAVNKFYEEHYG